MRKATAIVTIGLLLAIAAVAFSEPAAHAHEVITAKAAILIDNQTGEVLWQQNPDLPLPPASTTKVVTALLALQSGRLNDSLRVSRKAAKAPPSKIHLRAGWKLRLRDLVYAILLNSANDASVVIAQGLAGSVSHFADRMNAEARALGATHTHFVNPNGLPADNHYSTARDLATIFSHAIQNPLFEKIVSTKTATVSPTKGSRRRIALRNHNRLLGNYRIHVVGKTGWTIAAKKCFVGSAAMGGRELIVAVLGSHDLWGDLKRLLEFGFRGANPPVPEAPELEAAAGDGASVGSGDAEESSERYCVRLASFRDFTRARRLKTAVTRKGYRARITKVRRGRHRWYRVSIGSYSSRRTAQRAANHVKKTHKDLSPIIVASE